MNTEAIYSDETGQYVIPMEANPGDRVTIRLRVAHGHAREIYLLAQDTHYLMRPAQAGERFDYYETQVQLGDQSFSYCFSIRENEQEQCYFDKYGVSQEIRPEYAFRILPGFATPDWAKGAIMYQILVDRFANGDPTNDVLDNEYHYIKTMSRQIRDWNQLPNADFGVAEFYGGDLEGVRQKLYYLKSLGVEVIYFNPLFVSPSNHKYDIADYDHIDPHYGKIVLDQGQTLPEGARDNAGASRFINRVTAKENLEASNQFFADFIAEAHARGIRVILDGVFNHCGSFNKWLNREKIYRPDKGYAPGAYEAADSPYHDYFHFYDENQWPDNGTYEGWWGHDTLPKLNYEGSEDLYRYILEIGKKWVSPPYNVDGWRLDVAADLGHSPEFNHQFWRDFRKAVKSANPDAIILAEHYGDASSWLQGDAWDTVMNYDAFMEPISYFVTGMEKHSDAYEPGAQGDSERFENAMRYYMTKFTGSSLYTAMNQLSNHDHSRFLTRTNRMVGRVGTAGTAAASQDIDEAIFKQGVVMQMTLPGAPTLYYGDEAGVCGWTDPDNRRTYPWGHENFEILEFYRETIAIHRQHKVFKTGSYKPLVEQRDLLCYGRFDMDNAAFVLINTSDTDKTVSIPTWTLGVEDGESFERLIETSREFYNCGRVKVVQENNIVTVTVKANSSVIYHK